MLCRQQFRHVCGCTLPLLPPSPPIPPEGFGWGGAEGCPHPGGCGLFSPGPGRCRAPSRLGLVTRYLAGPAALLLFMGGGPR